MARKPRIHFPFANYHVVMRGNNKSDIFFDESDEEHLSYLISEALKQFECKLHAFCFMSNHFHLYVQIGEKFRLGECVKMFANKYSRDFNRKYGRVGHLFQNRHFASLVEDDSYSLTLLRYIHLNPVRANLLKDVDEFWWSSHSDYTGRMNRPWVTTTSLLFQFYEHDEVVARVAYHRYMHDVVAVSENEKIRMMGREQSSLAVEKLSLSREYDEAESQLNVIVDMICERYHITRGEIFYSKKTWHASEARGMLAWLLTKVKGQAPSKVAAFLGEDLSNLSKKLNSLGEQKGELIAWFEKQLADLAG